MRDAIPTFIEYLAEGFNAKLPDDINVYRNLHKYLVEKNFKYKQTPTTLASDRRFVYHRGSKTIIVVAHYAGKDIEVEIPRERTSARLAQDTLNDFIRDHVEPYVEACKE